MDNRQERRSGLCLSRYPGQTIVMKTASGEIIKFTYEGRKGQRIWLRFDAPGDTQIGRGEAWEDRCKKQPE